MKKVFVLGLDGANQKLLKEYVLKGYLPNFKKFLKTGSFAEALPCSYGATPINWATISTGSYSGTHGISTFLVHKPGTPMDKVENGFTSKICKSEFIWDAAQRAGLKTALISYPHSLPKTAKSNIVIGSTGTPGQFPVIHEAFNIELIDFKLPEKWKNVPEDRNIIKEMKFIVKPTDKTEWGLGTIQRMETGLNQMELYIGLVKNKNKKDSIILSLVKDWKEKIVEVFDKQWSDWVTLTFKNSSGKREIGYFQCYLDFTKKDLTFTSIYYEKELCDSAILRNELIEKFGYYGKYIGSVVYKNELASLQQAEAKGMWQVKAGTYLMDKHNVNICFSKWHYFDHIGHGLFNYIDPLSPWYKPSESKYWEKIFINAHQIADKMLGYLMNWADKDTSIVVISDHGEVVHINAVSINNILANNGLISFKKSKPAPKINWKKTKAFAHNSSNTQIRVNLKGRDPDGCVQPEDYEKVQEQIIDILLNVKDPKTRKRCFSVAIKKQDAASFGIWGDRVGDILYFANPGYTTEWFGLTNDLREVVCMGQHEKSSFNYGAPDYRSEHGSSLPSVSYGRGGESAIFGMWGNNIKKGYMRKNPIRLVDVTPTICYLMKFNPPRDCEGAILYNMLKQ